MTNRRSKEDVEKRKEAAAQGSTSTQRNNPEIKNAADFAEWLAKQTPQTDDRKTRQ